MCRSQDFSFSGFVASIIWNGIGQEAPGAPFASEQPIDHLIVVLFLVPSRLIQTVPNESRQTVMYKT
jgi:hypothetical protein